MNLIRETLDSIADKEPCRQVCTTCDVKYETALKAMNKYSKEIAMRFMVFQLGYTFHWGIARWESNTEDDIEFTHEQLYEKFMNEAGLYNSNI